MKNLRYICTQPAIDYYTWQVEVMIHNFVKNGVNPNNIDVVCSYKGVIPEVWLKLQHTYNNVRFFFYEDTRVASNYIVSVRPHLLKKHFAEHPYLTQDAIMYHDCDIIFTRPVNWNQYLTDNIWYGSDTSSYLGANYIKSKKYGVYERMCEIVELSETIPTSNERNSIGAQIIMKNVTVDYWEKVERDCEKLYQFFLDHLKAFPQTPKYHPIQKWTAEMWAILWNAWKFGHTTKVAHDMDFIWPGHNLDSWNKRIIYHNAGVSSQDEKMFFKGKYVNGKLPYDIHREDFNPQLSSIKYVEEIINTSRNSCLS